MTTRIGKNNQADKATKAAHGLSIHFTNGSQVLPLAGGTKPTTVNDLATALGLIASLRGATVAARAALTAAVATEKAQLPALVLLLDALVAYVRLTLGGNPQALVDFGLAPRKARAPMTTEQKAAAAAKRDATRKARGTTSAKAKAKIHGNVTGVTVTPVVAPAPAAAPAAPETSATPAVTPAAGATKPAS